MNGKKEQHDKSENKTRILVVDDHPVVRQGLTSLINSESDLLVCAEAEDANQALDVIEKQQFDFAVKDVKYDYIFAADYINFSDVDVVSIQHEFGLFGGQGGSYLSLLLKRLNKPIITTLHTILEDPSTEYFESLIDVCEDSDQVVVMNKRGIKMLRDIYGVPERKIKLIPHGIPEVPFTYNGYYKHILGVAGRKTILTFGLLGKNKGIEVMLRALPRILKTEPSILYVVLGATHPEVLRHEG